MLLIYIILFIPLLSYADNYNYCSWNKISYIDYENIFPNDNITAISNPWANTCNSMVIGSYYINNSLYNISSNTHLIGSENFYILNNTCKNSEKKTFVKKYKYYNIPKIIDFKDSKTVFISKNIYDFYEINENFTNIKYNQSCPICDYIKNGYYLTLCYGNCTFLNLSDTIDYKTITYNKDECELPSLIPVKPIDIINIIIYIFSLVSWMIPTNKIELTWNGFKTKVLINHIDIIRPGLIYATPLVVKHNIKPTQFVTMKLHEDNFFDTIKAGKIKIIINLITLCSLYYHIINDKNKINWATQLSLITVQSSVSIWLFIASAFNINNHRGKKTIYIIILKIFILIFGVIINFLPVFLSNNNYITIILILIFYLFQCIPPIFITEIFLILFILFTRYWLILIKVDPNSITFNITALHNKYGLILFGIIATINTILSLLSYILTINEITILFFKNVYNINNINNFDEDKHKIILFLYKWTKNINKWILGK